MSMKHNGNPVAFFEVNEGSPLRRRRHLWMLPVALVDLFLLGCRPLFKTAVDMFGNYRPEA